VHTVFFKYLMGIEAMALAYFLF